MCVIELDRDLLWQRSPVLIAAAEAPHQICQRAGHEEVLLHEAKAFAYGGGVVRVKHAGKRLGAKRLGQRADEVAAAEPLEVEVIRRRSGPEAQRVDGLAAVADDRTVERDADQGG